MSETRGLVKSALGFIIAILVIAGAVFGYDIKVDVTDTNNPASTEDVILTDEAPTETTDVVNVQNSPADSTPTEDGEPSVDESDMAEVTQPTDNTEDVVTEGEN